MKPVAEFDLPPEKAAVYARARRLEIWTLVYLAASTTLIGATMGGSQAMRTSFFEDALSSVPAIAFLACTRIARRKPNKEFPYGYHGAVSIGYLIASVALIAVGLFLLVEAAMTLISVERTTIGAMTLLGHTVWAGWPMLIAVACTTTPGVFLGRAKLQLAPQIHDKILYADATMMKADWMSGTATAVGVLGVGFGWCWLDPVAAAFVSIDIFKDGLVNLGVAFSDLMERRPMKTDRSGPDTLPEELRDWMEELDWVGEAHVRLREVGHVFFGEVFITPRGTVNDLPAHLRDATERAKQLNWRLHDVTITVIDGEQPRR
jgi:cation diffusion facilitator family transporter